MIEFDRVTISRGYGVVVADLSAQCPPGAVTVIQGSTLLARTAVVGAIGGTESYAGTIRVTGTVDPSPPACPSPALFVGFADATLAAHLTGYDNIRMLAGRRSRRHLIDEVAEPLLGPGMLDRRGREFGVAVRRRIQLVAAVLSGADNLAFDRVLDGEGAPTLAQLTTLLTDAPTVPAVLVTAPATLTASEAHSDELVFRSVPYG